MANIRACATGLLCIMSLQLAGCATKNPSSPTSRGILAGATMGALVGSAATQVGAPIGAALGGLAGGLAVNYTAKQKSLLQEIQSQQVQVIEIGEQVTLILPTDKFYLPCSPAIQREAYPVLDDIVQLLRTYPKTSVTITGYTDNLGSQQRNVALSRQRAQTIADYLWGQDIDARLVYTEGKGSADIVANNSYAQGRAWNRRIEINFQRLPN